MCLRNPQLYKKLFCSYAYGILFMTSKKWMFFSVFQLLPKPNGRYFAENISKWIF